MHPMAIRRIVGIVDPESNWIRQSARIKNWTTSLQPILLARLNPTTKQLLPLMNAILDMFILSPTWYDLTEHWITHKPMKSNFCHRMFHDRGFPDSKLTCRSDNHNTIVATVQTGRFKKTRKRITIRGYGAVMVISTYKPNASLPHLYFLRYE